METYDDDTMVCPLCNDEINECEYTVEVLVGRENYLPWQMQRSGYGAGTYCGECLTKCISCEQCMKSDDILYDDSTGAPLCGDCWCERWQYCDHCGDTVRTAESHYDDDTGYTLCSECRPRYSRSEEMSLTKCGTCDTYNVHFHILSEKYLCDCHAETVPAAYIVRTNTLQNA